MYSYQRWRILHNLIISIPLYGILMMSHLARGMMDHTEMVVGLFPLT